MSCGPPPPPPPQLKLPSKPSAPRNLPPITSQLSKITDQDKTWVMDIRDADDEYVQLAQKMLDEYWQKSHKHMLSVNLKKYNQTDGYPPTTLLFFCQDNDTIPQLVGQASVYRILEKQDDQTAALLIESVLISPTQRGRGFGSRLMKQIEQYLINQHSQKKHLKLYLSTRDRQGFYEHIGYKSIDFAVSPVKNPAMAARMASLNHFSTSTVTKSGGSMEYDWYCKQIDI